MSNLNYKFKDIICDLKFNTCADSKQEMAENWKKLRLLGEFLCCLVSEKKREPQPPIILPKPAGQTIDLGDSNITDLVIQALFICGRLFLPSDGTTTRDYTYSEGIITFTDPLPDPLVVEDACVTGSDSIIIIGYKEVDWCPGQAACNC